MLKMVDCFAGAGGLTYGFYHQGFVPVVTIEFSKDATLTYNANFKTNILPSDITNIDLMQQITKQWKNKIDLLIGGFPCQGFSMAGKRDVNDQRNQLYKYTVKYIKNLQPEVFVLENVKGILSFKEANGKLVIDKIQALCKQIGYYTKIIVLDSSNFSVAQKRQRVIFIGAKNHNQIKVDQVITYLQNYKSETKTVYDAIANLENVPENKIWSHIFANTLDKMLTKIKNTPVGKSVYPTYQDAYKRIAYDKVAPTVKQNHGGVFIHPKLNRLLTPRELARLQSFPDDFIFKGSKSSILQQIGNAVCPNISSVIAKIIKQTFFNINLKE